MTTPHASASARQLLVLGGSGHRDAALYAALAEVGAVRPVASAADALAALRVNAGDVVVIDAAEFPKLLHGTGQARAEAILEGLGLGICLLDRAGQLAWSNAALRSYPGRAIEVIRDACLRLSSEFVAELGSAPAPRSRRRGVSVDQDFYFDVTCAPLAGPDGQIQQFIVAVSDVTSTRRLQEKIDAIESAGRELVRLDAEALGQLDVGERLALLEVKIIEYCRDLLRFTHFNVRVLHRQNNRLETVLASGMSEEAKSLVMYAAPEGNGISGYVAATGRSYICPDVSKDPRYLPGIEHARSSLTVPLRLHDQVVGILNVESDQIAAFTEDDRQIAEIFGGYVAIALHILRLLAVERYATTGQIAADVANELAAPLNDIVTEASTLIEDYIGHDDLRKRLHTILDDVDRVKRSLRSVTEAPGVRGLVPENPDRDPILDGKRILVADDEDVIRETVSEVLTKLGAITVMAGDGDEAIAIIHSQPFDLVLSDIRMPQKDGYQVYSAVKQANPHCPVILITGFGYDPNHSIVRASKEGLAGVLYKPFKVEQLVEEVRHALTTNVI
ncbi:MAG: response regulator [Phycisphaerae bacterium]